MSGNQRAADSAAAEVRYPTSCRGIAVVGSLSLCLTFGGLSAWSALVPLSTAAIAEGTVVIAGSRKSVQHLEGGIVQRILVEDNDEVEEGQVLIELADVGAEAKFAAIVKRRAAVLAQKIRLEAERDGLPMPVVPSLATAAELHGEGAVELERAIAIEYELFEARQSTLDGERAILRRKWQAARDQLEAIEEEEASKVRQLALLHEEVVRVRHLLDKGYATRHELSALEREYERIQGERAALRSRSAATHEQIGQAELRAVQLEREFREDVARQLAAAEAEEQESEERLRDADDRRQRLALRAPVSGVVVALAVHTEGGVVTPGARVLDIVPHDRGLVVEAKLPPASVDGLRAGLEAQIMFTAFDRNRLAPVSGRVLSVSADRLVDAGTGLPHFLARIAVNETELDHLEGFKLVPGMPAEVMITKSGRTLLDYLMAPLHEVMLKSFRE